ncbi:hypothetical protein TRV_07215 [Trichophyton verrucosum HKI 0517]|uniref:Uncharacterized protein n=1 Tax=Trichophyton verrucosum (strain HKI 0517) TaxID=663202 RepID=D4DJ50_TRIVH|nr:uncharacterized protein TRV_07215 [Trichophyton verrucosum HKI 0517]EFE38135.1 hypothetical protein TRV_07215 [Trichophyton verrucosum HKI 0517]
MGVVRETIGLLRTRCLKSASSRQKLLRPSVGDNSAAGRRIIPAPSHDANIGVRIDRGVQVGNLVKIYVQPNKNATNKTIREMANKNSHQNIAETWVNVEDPVDNTTVDKVFDALDECAKENGH